MSGCFLFHNVAVAVDIFRHGKFGSEDQTVSTERPVSIFRFECESGCHFTTLVNEHRVFDTSELPLKRHLETSMLCHSEAVRQSGLVSTYASRSQS